MKFKEFIYRSFPIVFTFASINIYLKWTYSDKYCLPKTGCIFAPYGYTPIHIVAVIDLVLLIIFGIMLSCVETEKDEKADIKD